MIWSFLTAARDQVMALHSPIQMTLILTAKAKARLAEMQEAALSGGFIVIGYHSPPIR